MKRLILIFITVLIIIPASGQKYVTKNGYIGFFSQTPVEDIKADNNQVASIFDTSTGDIVFQVLIRSFHFKKAMMEEHFNENYMESEKFPKSTFAGKIKDFSSISLSLKGKYNVIVEGELTIHGVTKNITADGILEVTDEGIIATSKFTLSPEDFDIKIPSVVRNNIAKTVEVTVTMKYTG